MIKYVKSKIVKPLKELYNLESYWFELLFYFLVNAFLILYLLNLLFGIIEFIPDLIPIFGNLDEVVATLILLKTGKRFIALLLKEPKSSMDLLEEESEIIEVEIDEVLETESKEDKEPAISSLES